MEAIDTVMSRERIQGTIGYFMESPKILDGIVEVAEQQAEITWQAAERDLLTEIRGKWAFELAAGHPVMALRLEDWITLCKDKGVSNQDWWELDCHKGGE